MLKTFSPLFHYLIGISLDASGATSSPSAPGHICEEPDDNISPDPWAAPTFKDPPLLSAPHSLQPIFAHPGLQLLIQP